MSLMRSPARDPDTLDSLRVRLSELETALGERAEQIARTKVDLAAFSVCYHEQVGRLHAELEDLQRAVAETELIEITRRLESEPDQPASGSAEPPSEPAARFTSDAVRRLFRDVAKMIHPDLADDESTRDRRHALMVEANRAYAVGDEERLRWILEAWARRPEAIPRSDPEAFRERLVRRIAEAEEELAGAAATFAAMQESPMWQLKTMVDEAAARGKDLIADMVRRLKRDILVERNRLEAMHWHSRHD